MKRYPPLPRLHTLPDAILQCIGQRSLPPFPLKFSRDQLQQHGFYDAHHGPTPTSNWLIPQRVLMASSPFHQYHLHSSMDRVHKAVRAYLSCGIERFVCLQTHRELAPVSEGGMGFRYWNIVEDEARNMGSHVDMRKLQLVHFPVEDFGVQSNDRVDVFTDQLKQMVQTGSRIMLHCYGGHGRTGTIAAILLAKLYNMSAVEALAYVEACHDCRQDCRNQHAPQAECQFEQVLHIVTQYHQSVKLDCTSTIRLDEHRTTGQVMSHCNNNKITS